MTVIKKTNLTARNAIPGAAIDTSRDTIPVFFSCDDNYLPYLAVALRSIIDNIAPDSQYNYKITVLHNGINPARAARVAALATERVSIGFTDVSERLAPLMERLSLRDYYTVSIYFRLFIPSMFPEYDKAIYLDADIVVLDDLSRMYETDLGANLLGAVPDAVISGIEEFVEYSEYAVGIDYRKYFNSGVLLMNLRQMRRCGVEAQFAHLLQKYAFPTICPDQDYLNVICRGRVLYLDGGWNKMSCDRNYPGKPRLVHYNMFRKPWLYRGVPYEEYFHRYVPGCGFEDDIAAARASCGLRRKISDFIAYHRLLARATDITRADNNFRRLLGADAGFNTENDYDEYTATEADNEADENTGKIARPA